MNTIVVAGYNHKIRILTETVISEIANFSVKTDRFSVIKEAITKDYENVKFLKPYEQALYYCSLMLDDHLWPWNEKLEVLCHLEANDLAEFVQNLLSRTYMECYVAGNLEPSEANSLVQHIESVLFQGPSTVCKALLPSQHPACRTIMLEMGTSFYYPVEVLNSSDENSALAHYIQNNVKALIDAKLEKFKNLTEETSFYWSEIDEGTLKFGRTESEVAALRELNQQQLVDFFNQHVKVDAPLKKSLSVYVYGGLHSTEYDTIMSKSGQMKNRIDDIYSFKKSRPLYGSFKGSPGIMNSEIFLSNPNSGDSESVLVQRRQT